MTKNKLHILETDQKTFIKAKIKSLGSIKKVKQFYSKPCTVTKYALKIAKEFYK